MNREKPNTIEIEELFTAKKKFHKERASLPITEKIKILVQLQQLAINISNSTGKKNTRVAWKIL